MFEEQKLAFKLAYIFDITKVKNDMKKFQIFKIYSEEEEEYIPRIRSYKE